MKNLNCGEHVRNGKILSQLNHCVRVNVYVRGCMFMYVCVIFEKIKKSICGDGVFGTVCRYGVVVMVVDFLRLLHFEVWCHVT